MQFKGNLSGFNNLDSGNQGGSYICSILLNARWKSILIEFKVKLGKKVFPALWYRKQLGVLHKSEELIECIFPDFSGHSHWSLLVLRLLCCFLEDSLQSSSSLSYSWMAGRARLEGMSA